jgi:hypothetical protein
MYAVVLYNLLDKIFSKSLRKDVPHSVIGQNFLWGLDRCQPKHASAWAVHSDQNGSTYILSPEFLPKP